MSSERFYRLSRRKFLASTAVLALGGPSADGAPPAPLTHPPRPDTRDRKPLAVDGYDDAGWILLDFDSVLAHVFLPGERSYYDLESLWAPAAKRRRRAASA